MEVHRELKDWVNGFKDMASYHTGDYQQGMNHVLQGIEGQLNWIQNLEVKSLNGFVDFVNKNILDKPDNTMQQHLNDYLTINK